tara:strand:+ start:11831 stop:11965 length:135 start_codon:yes stop_codon:yes gene_type:complete
MKYNDFAARLSRAVGEGSEQMSRTTETSRRRQILNRTFHPKTDE